MTELARLQEIEKFILERLGVYGLKVIPQKFDIISEDRMFALLARVLPNNFSFWQFGRDYERFRTKFEHGFGHGILEVVFNLDPSRAYILNTVPFVSKVLTTAHVYGHNHFFSNNIYFRNTRRNILSAASAARERFLEYENRFGIDKVEEIINAAKAFEVNVDPDLGRLHETQKQLRNRLLKVLAEVPENEQALKPLSKKMKQEHQKFKEETESKRPVFQERDILFFILENSPMIEDIRDKAWQAAVLDIISVMWEQSRYFMPQRETHGMNEGFAVLIHEFLIHDLLKYGLLTAEEFSDYSELNGRVLANNPDNFNQYLFFSLIWKSIKERWNKGQFGKEWEECRDAGVKNIWDTKADLGQKKILQVCETHSDWRFIDEFLTQEIVDELLCFDGDGMTDVKPVILRAFENFGRPLVHVKNGNFENRRELMLDHVYNGREMDLEYLEKTLQHGHTLWGRPVHLRTNVGKDRECTIFTYTEKSLKKARGCKTGECLHIGQVKDKQQ